MRHRQLQPARTLLGKAKAAVMPTGKICSPSTQCSMAYSRNTECTKACILHLTQVTFAKPKFCLTDLQPKA